MTPDFERAVGGMADIPQWFVWRLEWDDAQGKFLKTPCALDGSVYRIDASLPECWNDYDRVAAVVPRLNAGVSNGHLRYAMGFWMTVDCGYWFLDIDKCVQSEALLPFAQQLVEAFPNAMMEWSSSRKGLHIIGRGQIPPHRNKPAREVAQQLAPMQLEFYSEDRGIAFGLDGVAQGNADTIFNVGPLCAQYFPPRESLGSDRRPEWRGPQDDDVLIERMLNARQSAASAFGGKASLQQLWRGDCELNSEHDMALASHLAFWTGCDGERIDRLMRRSALVRAKWNDRRPGGTYLTYTIERACDGCENVYQEPERNLTVQTEMYGVATTHVQGELISSEVFARVNELLDKVSACGNEEEMHNKVIPMIQQASIPGALQERLVGAVKKQLKFWGNDMGVARIRALLFPAAIRSAAQGELPEWAKPYCFVSNGDYFFNTTNTQQLTMVGFQAIHGRYMPVNDQGRRENAAEKCLHFWGMPLVDQVGYRPDQGPYYVWDGQTYANRYSPSSLPQLSAYTPEGIAGITAFQAMLFDMCGRRDDVFHNLLYWMAHNVQKPGVKIRWSPIIKGVNGDGKTLAAVVLRAAMGYRNVSTTSNSNVSNSGGFTDWAVRGAVNVIEEIMLTGKPRHQLYNAMKEFISNNIVDINPKGGKPFQTFNTTNHWANTNHNDALPMEKTDRRWFVIFTPWASLEEMMRYCGLDAAGWKARTDAIDHAKENCAGELRAWFLSLPIPATFDINGSAMMTPEKRRMMASSAEDAETVAADIISNGSVGISESVLSSSMLSTQLAYRANQDGFEVPQKTALNHMLTRLGYSKMEKQIKWNGRTHTIWVKNGVELDNDAVRFALDTSNHLQTHLQT